MQQVALELLNNVTAKHTPGCVQEFFFYRSFYIICRDEVLCLKVMSPSSFYPHSTQLYDSFEIKLDYFLCL